MARVLAILSMLVLVAGCTSTATPGLPTAAADYSGSDECLAPADELWLVEEVLRLVNEVRVEAGLSKLVLDDTLSDTASDYACEMIEQDFFAHVSPITGTSPGERLTIAGYIYWAMGRISLVDRPRRPK